mgnify:CR=1 FL=1
MKNKKRAYFQLFNAFISPYYIIVVIATIFFSIVNEELKVYGLFFLSIVLWSFFHKIALIIHEFGHVIFGKIAGGKPHHIILGVGHEIIKFDWLGIKITLNQKLHSGFALATFTKKPFLKLRYLLYISGGLIANILATILVLLIFGFQLESIIGQKGFIATIPFAAANISIFISAIIPNTIHYRGIKLKSDGLCIIQLASWEEDSIITDAFEIDFLDALDYFDNQEFEKAREIYQKLSTSREKSIKNLAMFNLAAIEMSNTHIETAFNVFQAFKQESDPAFFSAYEAIWNNNMAWCYLLINNKNLEKADEHSKIAFEINPMEPRIQQTRGSILIEKGDWEEGIRILSPLMDFEFVNDTTVSSAMYLCYGLYQQNKFKLARRHYDFVVKHISALIPLEHRIWDSIVERLQMIAEEKRTPDE